MCARRIRRPHEPILGAAVAVFAVIYSAADQVGANDIITGTDAGTAAHVKGFTGAGGVETASFLPYGGFTGGVRVATGDVNNDGIADIVTGAGPGAGPHVKVFSGINQAELKSFFAYSPTFAGGVYVASGDVNGDGFDDIITGTGAGGGTHVKAIDSVGGGDLRSFFAYPGVDIEVRVAAGDVNGDGFADIITSLGEGAAPHVKVFDGTNLALLRSFFAYSPGFTGGVYVAAGDVNGDGHADIITGAGVDGATHVKVFNGATPGEIYSFLAYPGVNNEVRVGAGDVNGDGIDDIITGLGPGALSHVKAFDGTNVSLLLRSFFAYGTGFTGGGYVAGAPSERIPEPTSLFLAVVGAMVVGKRSFTRRLRVQ